MSTILVVDDRPLNRELLRAALGMQGHRVLEARDGRDALALVRAERPALVICDILMPTMDGYEFVRQLRAEPQVASTPVIFCTAHYHMREAKGLAATAGVARVLTKPCEPKEVIAVVDEVLTGKGARPPQAPEEGEYQRKHLRLVTDKLSETTDELRNSNDRLRALVDLNMRLVTLRDPLHLLDEACRGARELIGARHGALGVRDRSNGETRRFFTSGFAADPALTFAGAALDEGELSEVIAKRHTMRLSFPRARRIAGLPPGYPAVRSLIAAPVTSLTVAYGWICLTDKVGADSFSSDDEQLLSLVAALSGRGYENGTAYQRLRRQATTHLQSRARRLVDVQESERRVLARELHERVGRNLNVVSTSLERLRANGADIEDVRQKLGASIELVGSAARTIENVMAELQPPALKAEGLLPALRRHAELFSKSTGINVTVQGELPAQRPGAEIEITLFRIAAEALANVAKHAHASRADLTLDQTESEFTLVVTDDGHGFEPQSANPGRGLAAMRERTEAIGGHFEVTSMAGEGTRIAASIPVE
jgi:signal transduction histidine kinase/DNA-binding NarL/FixJ family response regulator